MRQNCIKAIFKTVMRKKSNTTLKELAGHLNLSISTISRALKDHPDISLSTRERVKKLAKELNYYPNIFAQGFRTHRSHILGVIVPNISHDFTSTILKGILNEGESMGYRIIVFESNNDENKQMEMLRTMISFGVDGILMALTRKTESINYVLEVMNYVPLVLFDKVSSKIPCSQVVIDDEMAAYHAVEHLISMGKKRIAIIKESENSYNSEKRYMGYLKALEEYNIELDPKIVLSTEDMSFEKGKHIGNYLIGMKNRPDALFTIADSAAIGAIKAFNKHKIKIPEEIAVVGFSDSKSCKFIHPELSSVEQPGEKIGQVAIKTIIEEIENPLKITFSKTIEIKTSLKIRESSLL